MTRSNRDRPQQTLKKHLVNPSLKFWIIIPLLIVFIFLVSALAISYLNTGQVSPALLIILLISVAAFIGPGLFITRHVMRRIEQIISAAKRVAEGNLSIRIDDETDDEIGLLVRAFNQMVKNLDHLQRSRDLLSRTMSPAVRHSLMERGLDFRGITQMVSVLFIDIRDFTHLTEGHSTEQLVFFLNDYYTTIANQVHIGGGIIGKYGGDSILAYFGAPDPEPPAKSATAAFLTALALGDALDELSERWKVLGLPTVRAGIGLSMGEVVAGPIGSEEQFEYTVIGNAVNLAARLQSLTRNVDGYNIILSVESYEALEQRIKHQIPVISAAAFDEMSEAERARRPVQFVDLGEVLVKGKRGPVHVYGIPDYGSESDNPSILRRNGDPSPSQRDRTASQPMNK